jgi:hypothetical protein
MTICATMLNIIGRNASLIAKSHLKTFSSKVRCLSTMDPKDFTVPVPWGHIAGRT